MPATQKKSEYSEKRGQTYLFVLMISSIPCSSLARFLLLSNSALNLVTEADNPLRVIPKDEAGSYSGKMKTGWAKDYVPVIFKTAIYESPYINYQSFSDKGDLSEFGHS